MTNKELKKLIEHCDSVMNGYQPTTEELEYIHKVARELAHMTLKFRGAEQ